MENDNFLEKFWDKLKDYFAKEPLTIIKKIEKEEKVWFPLCICCWQNSGQTAFTKFKHWIYEFAYEIVSFQLRSNYDDGFRFIFKINGDLYPSQTFYVTETEFTPKQIDKDYSSYHSREDEVVTYPFKLKVNANWKFEPYCCNEGVAGQGLFMIINGFMHFKDNIV